MAASPFGIMGMVKRLSPAVLMPSQYTPESWGLTLRIGRILSHQQQRRGRVYGKSYNSNNEIFRGF